VKRLDEHVHLKCALEARSDISGRAFSAAFAQLRPRGFTSGYLHCAPSVRL